MTQAGIDSARASISGLGAAAGTAASVGVAALAAGGAVIAGGLAVGIKAAGDLEQSIANISTIKPEIDTSGVFAALNEMQTRVPMSAAQLGESMYDIFSSVSVSQEEGVALTEKFAKAAVGAQTDAKTFGTAAMGVMNAYGLAVADADHISDVFFNTIAAGVVTGPQLAAGLGPLTSTAKAAGVSIDTLGGLMVGVTKQGGDAAQNLNNLNNFLMKVTTEDAVKNMRALGVSVVDSTGNFREMPAVLTDLKVRLADMTEAERANAMQAIFPDAQARQGAQVVMDQLDAVNAAVETNRTTAGATEQAYAKMSATFNSQLKLLQNSLTSVLTTIGGAILPVITPLITALAKQLPGAMKAATAAFASLTIAGTPIVQFFKDLWGTVQQVFAGDWSPDASINPVINALGTLAIAVRELTRGDLPAFISAITSGLMDLTQNVILPQLAAWARAFLDWIGPMIPPLLGQLVSLYTQLEVWFLGTALPGIIESLASWAAAFLDWVVPMIPPLLRELGHLLERLVTWLINPALPGLVAKLVEWGLALTAWIAPRIGPMLLELGKLLGEILEWIVRTGRESIRPAAVGLGTSLVNGMVSGLTGLLEALVKAISGAISQIRIDIGPFHLSSSGFRIDAPNIGQPSIESHALGGYVGGMTGQPRLIIAHGGEQIIPVGGAGGGSGQVTININGAQSPSAIVAEIDAYFQRRQRLARIGAV